MPRHKLFWSYICDNCDNAGVWQVDLELAAFQCGYEFKEKDVLGAFDGRIRDIGKGRWWVVKFVRFQCGELSDRSKPHQHVLRLLARHTLSKEYAETIAEGYGKGIHTLKEKDGKEEREETEEGKKKTRPASAAEVADYCKALGLPPTDAEYFWNKWVGNGYKNNKSPMKDWQAVIRSWKAAGHCPSQQQKHGNQKNNAESTRNVGTANQGRSRQYAGIGRVPRVSDAK